MKISLTFSLCGAVVLTLAGCATRPGIYQPVNGQQNAQRLGTADIGIQQNVMRPSEASDFELKLNPKLTDRVIAAKWATLKPLAEKVVSVSACGVGSEEVAWKSMGRWVDPDTNFLQTNLALAISRTRYHPRSACMTILRIDNWSMPANNAVSFRVQFVSDVSNETVPISYLFRANEEGTWLLSRIPGQL